MKHELAASDVQGQVAAGSSAMAPVESLEGCASKSQAGYSSTLHDFVKADVQSILKSLQTFVPDADDSQVRAWRESVRLLKEAIRDLLAQLPELDVRSAIVLEYRVPLESRRIDSVLLLSGAIVVLEFKGRSWGSQADEDQAAAYARDLCAYHRHCAGLPVKCGLVLTRSTESSKSHADLRVLGPRDLPQFLADVIHSGRGVPSIDEFLSADAYQPLPSLIKAARELFQSGTLRRIHRAAAATQPTLETCSEIVHRTARAKRRALILICGVPGAGKTLVGLQLAHSRFLDDLAVLRGNGGKPTAAAVFLSGNGPLVEVLQYELKGAGGGGKAFVRGVHDYVSTFTASSSMIPPQHVLIYDEAQRAFDAAQVEAKHKNLPTAFRGMSEPELFIRFAERIPEWCVVVGLIGAGQEIHVGEEAGIGQWRSAVTASTESDSWDVYAPNTALVQPQFQGMPHLEFRRALELSATIRFHLATQLDRFVECVLAGKSEQAAQISRRLEESHFNLRLSRNLERAKNYLRTRYDGNSDARYGLIASAKDKDLVKHGVEKGFKSPGEVSAGKYGRWYAGAAGQGSCVDLKSLVTEFGAQGLELDGCLLAWGSDLLRRDGEWSNQFASGYREPARVKDPKSLRLNAYRVLLTRGRDCCVVFVPPEDKLSETYLYLRDCGFAELAESGAEAAVASEYP